MKKAIVLIAILVSASSLFAQQQGCVGVAVGSQEKNGGRFDATFSATQVIDIDFSILFTPGAAKKFANQHVVEFRILTPRGHLYQSISVPFSSDPEKKGKTVIVPGYPQPLAIQGMSEVTFENAKHLTASVRLPVAGTPIVTNSLYGTWTAQAFVDGDSLPCSKPVTFVVMP